MQTESKMHSVPLLKTHTCTHTQQGWESRRYTHPSARAKTGRCPGRHLWELTGLCWEAEAPEASVAQDVEVVVGLGVVIIHLLSAEASRHSFRLDTACRGRRQARAPFLLCRRHSPEATFHGMDSERFLVKTNQPQSVYVGMLFKSYSPT